MCLQLCMYGCVSPNNVFFRLAVWVSCSNNLSCADVAFLVEIVCGTMNGQLPVLTVFIQSGVVIDLNVGHPNSLWPADEHSAHAD